jgi:hypothetical protein
MLLLVTDNVPCVMEQVGHGDQDTTNRIYRHLIRLRQQHGSAFDRVVSEARQAFGTPLRATRVWTEKGLAATTAQTRQTTFDHRDTKGLLLRPFSTRPTGFEPVTSCSGGKRSIH